MLRKSCLNPSKVTWEPEPLYSCNIYSHCSFSCLYCWARYKSGLSSEEWAKAEKVDNALELIEERKNKIKPGTVIFSLTTDAFQNPADHDFVQSCLKALLESPHHILILTKSHHIVQYYDLISQHENVEVGFTFTSLKKTRWEKNAPGPEERIFALEEAAQYGPHSIPGYDAPCHIKTYVSIEPALPGVTDPIEIIGSLCDLVDHWIIGKLNHMKVPDAYYRQKLPLWVRWLEKNKVRYYLKPEIAAFLPAGHPYKTRPRSTSS